MEVIKRSLALLSFPLVKNRTKTDETEFLSYITKEQSDVKVLNFQGCKDAVSDLFDHGDIEFSPKLEILNISTCELNTIPVKILSLMQLKELYLSSNVLHVLPDEISALKNLEVITLSFNLLEELPRTLKLLEKLVQLDISHNKLTQIPEVLYDGLHNLQLLDISHNYIQEFNKPPACLNRIIELKISNNLLTKEPAWIFFSRCRIKKIDLSLNNFVQGINITSVDVYCLGPFQTISSMNLENCKLNDKKMNFLLQLKNVNTLYLGNTAESNRNTWDNLESVIFKNCISLQHLYLNNGGISILPKDLSYLHKIRILDLSHNILSWLPDSFCDLQMLEICNLSSNSIVLLPQNIGQLVNLKEINLSSNLLYEIPDSFIQLKCLEYADFYSNQIECLPADIFKMPLKGLDLEVNCINFKIMAENDADNLIKKYENLKLSFRDRAREHHNRFNYQCQTLTNVNEEEPDDPSDHCIDSDDVSATEETESNDVTIGDNMTENNFSMAIENWEDEDHDKKKKQGMDHGSPLDDAFDPYEVPQKLDPISKIKRQMGVFRDNFCPADWHMQPNIAKFAFEMKKYSRTVNYSVEGQFDSD